MHGPATFVRTDMYLSGPSEEGGETTGMIDLR